MARDLDFERSIFSHNQAQSAPNGPNLFETYADKVMRRVDEVLAGENCKWPPSLRVKDFLRALRNHQGKDRAVSLGLLCELLRLTPREGKKIVEELRIDFRVQLGASREADNGGYYLISNQEESIESSAQMVHQAVTMLRVAAAMRGGGEAIQQMLTQLSLELQEDADAEVRRG